MIILFPFFPLFSSAGCTEPLVRDIRTDLTKLSKRYSIGLKTSVVNRPALVEAEVRADLPLALLRDCCDAVIIATRIFAEVLLIRKEELGKPIVLEQRVVDLEVLSSREGHHTASGFKKARHSVIFSQLR